MHQAMTRNFHIADPKILGAIVKILLAMATRLLGFVHLCQTTEHFILEGRNL